jgi:hypothetical protein
MRGGGRGPAPGSYGAGGLAAPAPQIQLSSRVSFFESSFVKCLFSCRHRARLGCRVLTSFLCAVQVAEACSPQRSFQRLCEENALVRFTSRPAWRPAEFYRRAASASIDFSLIGDSESASNQHCWRLYEPSDQAVTTPALSLSVPEQGEIIVPLYRENYVFSNSD